MPRRKHHTAPTKPRQRSCPEYSDGPANRFHRWPSPESLHPDADTVFNAICGNLSSRCIVDAYAFRFPVTIVQEVLA